MARKITLKGSYFASSYHQWSMQVISVSCGACRDRVYSGPKCKSVLHSCSLCKLLHGSYILVFHWEHPCCHSKWSPWYSIQVFVHCLFHVWEVHEVYYICKLWQTLTFMFSIFTFPEEEIFPKTLTTDFLDDFKDLMQWLYGDTWTGLTPPIL